MSEKLDKLIKLLIKSAEGSVRWAKLALYTDLSDDELMQINNKERIKWLEELEKL